MIVSKPDGYYLYSKDGNKKLGGPYPSRDGAIKREKQVQYFKSQKGAAFIRKRASKLLDMNPAYKAEKTKHIKDAAKISKSKNSIRVPGMSQGLSKLGFKRID